MANSQNLLMGRLCIQQQERTATKCNIKLTPTAFNYITHHMMAAAGIQNNDSPYPIPVCTLVAPTTNLLNKYQITWHDIFITNAFFFFLKYKN